MGYLTSSQANKLCDDLVQLYARIKSGIGASSASGAWQVAEHIAALVEASADASFADRSIQSALSAPSISLVNVMQAPKIARSCCSGFFASLSSVAANLGTNPSLSPDPVRAITDLDSFLYYYNVTNTGAPNAALQAPEFGELYQLLRGSPIDRLNLYFPVVQGATYTNALAKFVVSGAVFTSGFTIDRASYAGGIPYVQWTGGTGSGASTITVTGEDQNGVSGSYTLSGTWGSGAFVATQAGVALTLPSASKLITKVTAVAVTGMTGGTLYVESRPPAGRTWPLV
jgi:hypothetical protein